MRILTTLLLTCLLSSLSFAQNTGQNNENTDNAKKKGFSWDRVYVGGDAWARFGNFTNVSVSPLIGYSITDKWSAGIGGKYIYYRESFPSSGWRYSTSMYGGSVFTRYLIGRSIILHGEFESINREIVEPFSNQPVRKWINMGLIGGGYRQGFGNTYFQLIALYDLIDDPNSPYWSQYIFGSQGPPIILRGGVTIGL